MTTSGIETDGGEAGAVSSLAVTIRVLVAAACAATDGEKPVFCCVEVQLGHRRVTLS